MELEELPDFRFDDLLFELFDLLDSLLLEYDFLESFVADPKIESEILLLIPTRASLSDELDEEDRDLDEEGDFSEVCFFLSFIFSARVSTSICSTRDSSLFEDFLDDLWWWCSWSLIFSARESSFSWGVSDILDIGKVDS